MPAERAEEEVETRPGNLILDALPSSEREGLFRHLEPRRFERNEVLHEVGEPVERVYFPLSGVFSLMILLSDGSTVEMATVGREGVVGAPSYLEGAAWPNARVLVQVAGEALVIDVEPFAEEVERSRPLHVLLHRHTQALLVQIGQTVACNRLHPVGQRTARWLLQYQDRVGDEFALTHELLAAMLGVRRASVTHTAGSLQRQGLIRYQRGRVTILDREGLSAASCECYETVAREVARLLPTAGP